MVRLDQGNILLQELTDFLVPVLSSNKDASTIHYCAQALYRRLSQPPLPNERYKSECLYIKICRDGW
jgi:hypothetical protein